MAYYLMIEDKERGKYKKISLFKLDKFIRLSHYKNDVYGLKEIDNFTSMFTNESELKLFLYSNLLIDSLDTKRAISIRENNKGKFERVEYGIIYQGKDIYLQDSFMSDYLCSMYNNLDFLTKLINKYQNNYNSKSFSSVDINIIRNLIKGYPETKEKIRYYLREFYLHEVYKEIIETGEIKEKYRSRHNLAAFVIHYEKQVAKEEIESKKDFSENHYDNIYQSGNLSSPDYKPKVKSRKKVEEEINGQISFNDLL